MNLSNKEYQQLTKKYESKSPLLADLFKAFLVGGLICTLGQGLIELYKSLGIEEEQAYTFCSMTLVLLSALLTGLGLYAKIAAFGGAGSLVPISGFANGITACAIEFKTEGWVTGTGAKIFSIAGPVITYGTLCSVVYGVILWGYFTVV